jgi:hypothetical protein
VSALLGHARPLSTLSPDGGMLVVVDQSRADLKRHLQEQLSLLRVNAEAFDRGVEEASKVLAVVIRTLVHDTPKSPALLAQLGMLDSLSFLSTRIHDDTPVRGILSAVWDAGLAHITLSGRDAPARFEPPLGGEDDDDEEPSWAPGQRLPFVDWWTREPILVIVRDERGIAFCRKQFVLWLANKDGGGHVDPQLPSAYAAIARMNAAGWFAGAGMVTTGSGPDVEPMGSPVPANVRQIAFEVESTLDGVAT